MEGAITNTHLFDSLERNSTHDTWHSKISILPTDSMCSILKLFIEFWNIYVCDGDRSLTFHDFTKGFEQLSTPQQSNFHDCSLFMVSVVLHLLSNVDLKADTFNQGHISLLYQTISNIFANASKKKNPHYDSLKHMPADVIYNCFPSLFWDVTKHGEDPHHII